MTENSGRYVYLDNVRNNLVYSVVFLHTAFMFAYPVSFWWPVFDKAASSSIYEMFVLVCDAFQMPILMFTAVLFVFPSLKKNTTTGYLKKRFMRLMVPVFVFTACAADSIYQMRYKQVGLDTRTYLDTFIGYWKDLFFGPGVVFMQKIPFLHPGFTPGHTWFMSFLFVVTLVIVFFSKFTKGEKIGPVSVESNRNVVFKTAMLFLIFTFMYLAGIIALAGNNIELSDQLIIGEFLMVRPDQGMQLVLFALFGLYVHKKQWLTNSDIGSWKFWGVTSLLVMVVFIVLHYDQFIPFINECAVIMDHNKFGTNLQPLPEVPNTLMLLFLLHYVLVLWLCLCLLMFFISLTKCFFNRPNAITSFCSKHSIYVYVMHIIPVLLLQHVFKDVAMPSLLKVALITLIVICACLWLSHRLVYPYPKTAIAFFAVLKTVALFAGFTFYYYALLMLTFVAFVGAMVEGARYFLTVKNTGLAGEAY